MISWVRLWHEMPTDPKWRVISRKSGRPIHEIIAVFSMMLINASQSENRGTLENWNDEDVAAALDLETETVTSIRAAMQGKVLDGLKIIGWKNKQPCREWGNYPDNRSCTTEWIILRKIVFERDDYTCHYCGKRGVRLECDHVIPISRGGSNEISNLVTACFECNRSKRDKTVAEWRAE